MSNTKRALIVVTSHSKLGDTGKTTGYYLPEVSHPAEVFKKAGFEIDFTSPQGGKAPMDPNYDKADSANQALLGDTTLMAKLTNTLKPDQVDPSRYNAIFFAGGHGTMWDFRENLALQKITRDIFENDGIVSAVCHGPAALVDVKLSNGKYLVQGKKVAAFSDAEEIAYEMAKVVPFLLETELVKKGAVYSKADLWQKHVQVDGNLVTGQNPASAAGVAEEVVRVYSQR